MHYSFSMSLYVTNIDRVIRIKNPADCSATSNFSLNGFLLIPSIINSTTFPPSSGGNGRRFVTPSDNDITDNIYMKSANPLVCDTTFEIPTGPII